MFVLVVLVLVAVVFVFVSYVLRELFCDRNPGDARVKVGSERKVAS